MSRPTSDTGRLARGILDYGGRSAEGGHQRHWNAGFYVVADREPGLRAMRLICSASVETQSTRQGAGVSGFSNFIDRPATKLSFEAFHRPLSEPTVGAS